MGKPANFAPQKKDYDKTILLFACFSVHHFIWSYADYKSVVGNFSHSQCAIRVKSEYLIYYGAIYDEHEPVFHTHRDAVDE